MAVETVSESEKMTDASTPQNQLGSRQIETCTVRCFATPELVILPKTDPMNCFLVVHTVTCYNLSGVHNSVHKQSDMRLTRDRVTVRVTTRGLHRASTCDNAIIFHLVGRTLRSSPQTIFACSPPVGRLISFSPGTKFG